jgi:hypothetical protein
MTGFRLIWNHVRQSMTEKIVQLTSDEMELIHRDALPIRMLRIATISRSLKNSVIPNRLDFAPIAWVDVQRYPHVRDLMRVHQVDGQGDIETNWSLVIGTEWLMVLHVIYLRPVKCDVLMVWNLLSDEELSWLFVVAAQNRFALCFSPPPVDVTNIKTQLLSMSVNGASLRRQLNLFIRSIKLHYASPNGKR